MTRFFLSGAGFEPASIFVIVVYVSEMGVHSLQFTAVMFSIETLMKMVASKLPLSVLRQEG